MINVKANIKAPKEFSIEGVTLWDNVYSKVGDEFYQEEDRLLYWRIKRKTFVICENIRDAITGGSLE